MELIACASEGPCVTGRGARGGQAGPGRGGLLWRRQEAPGGTCKSGLETAGRRTLGGAGQTPRPRPPRPPLPARPAAPWPSLRSRRPSGAILPRNTPLPYRLPERNPLASDSTKVTPLQFTITSDLLNYAFGISFEF